tara:strand:- start:1241 stop:1462 length:222 start_codon:yes stop_codon:yes gene_type:complete
MKVGDLVRMDKGAFMQGLMGIIVYQKANADDRWYIQFIGPDVPKPIQGKAIPFRTARFSLLKSSNNGVLNESR